MDTSPQLRDAVWKVYSEVAEAPEAEHPFSVGRQFAAGLGYPAEILERLPAAAVEAFTGASTVSMFAELPEGATVLDVGCGAGMDTLIAAQRVGPRGRVIGVDFSGTMLARARRAADEMGLGNVEFHRADAERLPLKAACVDVALANGIFNLNPAREAIFHELARVVKAGGAFYGAELILREPLSVEERSDLTDWFS